MWSLTHCLMSRTALLRVSGCERLLGAEEHGHRHQVDRLVERHDGYGALGEREAKELREGRIDASMTMKCVVKTVEMAIFRSRFAGKRTP